MIPSQSGREESAARIPSRFGKARFRTALKTRGDPAMTSIILLTRADRGALREAARTLDEVRAPGLGDVTKPSLDRAIKSCIQE